MRGLATLACALLASVVGCGEEKKLEGSPDPQTERVDRPAQPPAGWYTVKNRVAGFTVSVPDGWTVRKRSGATLVRSTDQLLVVTVAADRSKSGRDTRSRRYARQAFRALPGFKRLRLTKSGPVRGSRYESSRADGSGVLDKRRQRQRLTVAAFRRPGRVTYTAIAFRAEVSGRAPYGAALATLLRSFRMRRPGS